MNAPAITFVTGNANKVKQLSWHLHRPLAHRHLDLAEVQSLDLREVVAAKAQEAYRQLDSPVLVEDISLRFTALGRLPGPFIKWFLQELDNTGLCDLLNGHEDRTATAEVLFGLQDETGLHTFHGSQTGTIAARPYGDKLFGFDPIFIPSGHELTWAQMSKQENMATSMRRPALQQLEAFLCARDSETQA